MGATRTRRIAGTDRDTERRSGLSDPRPPACDGSGTPSQPDSVVVEAALSFLGFGISQPEASLGNMLTEARTYFFRNPWLVACREWCSW